MKVCIYSNYDLCDEYDEFIQEHTKTNDCSEEDIQQMLEEMDRFRWEEVSGDLQEFFNDGSAWIMAGTVGRWNGRYVCIAVVQDFRDAYRKATVDCDCVAITEEDGKLFIQSSHHDGTNYFELRRFKEEGLKYYEICKSGAATGKLLNTIWEKYTEPPYFVKKVYPHLKEGSKWNEYSRDKRLSENYKSPSA